VATSDTAPRSAPHRIAQYRRFKIVIVGAAAVLGLSLIAAAPALADPHNPTTSEDAQQAWLASSHRAEALNEEVLVAQQTQQRATAAAAAAGKSVIRARHAVSGAKARAAAAETAAASYRRKVDEFANASFRGAHLNQFTVLLTADSADDYLDQVSSLDRVAQDTQQTLNQALAARSAAKQATADADAARARAEKAKTDADAAKATADHATADVTARKGALDAEVAHDKQLVSTLSARERQAAVDAAQQAREAEAAAAAQAAAAAGDTQNVAPVPASLDTAPAANRSRTDAIAPDAAAAPAPDPSTQAAAPAAAPAASSAAQTAVAAALSKEGAPYVYGAAGPDAFDCSGLTSWAWAQAGVSIPRTSSDQGNLPEVPLSELQPGDLVTYYSPVSHVALYIGNGQVIHASTESMPVYITTIAGAGPNPVGHRVTG